MTSFLQILLSCTHAASVRLLLFSETTSKCAFHVCKFCFVSAYYQCCLPRTCTAVCTQNFYFLIPKWNVRTYGVPTVRDRMRSTGGSHLRLRGRKETPNPLCRSSEARCFRTASARWQTWAQSRLRCQTYSRTHILMHACEETDACFQQNRCSFRG
jgi:hypothetical protein